MIDIETKNENKNIINKIVKFSIPSIVSFFINIFSAIIVTRYYSPSDYGLINTFNATSIFLMSIISLGLDSGFIRYYFDLPQGFSKKELFITSIFVPLITLIFFSLIIYIFFSKNLSILIFGFDNWYLLFLLFLNIFSSLFIRFFSILFRMDGDTFTYTVIIIGAQLALKGALIFAALIKPSLIFSLNSIVISTLFVIFGFIISYYKKFIPNQIQFLNNLKNLFDFFKYSLYSWPVPTLLYFNSLATLLIIRNKIGIDAVGVFSSVSVFIGLIGVLQAGFSTFWSGYMYENFDKKQKQIKKINDIVLLLTVLLIVGFVIFRDLVYFLIGKNYHETKSYFAILLIYPVMLILTETTSYGISIAKKSGLLLIITFLTILFNLILTLVLVSKFEILGASLASALSGLFFFSLQTYYGQKYYRSVENINKVFLTIFYIFIIAFGNLFLNHSTLLLTIFCIIILAVILYTYKSVVGILIKLLINKLKLVNVS